MTQANGIGIQNTSFTQKVWETQSNGMLEYLTNPEEGLLLQKSLICILGKITEPGEDLDGDTVKHLHRLCLFGEMQLGLMVTKMELKN